MMTTGIFLAVAALTGRSNATSSSGASTMPPMPSLVNWSTILIWSARSDSLSGPLKLMLTPNSLPALLAPACTDFQ